MTITPLYRLSLSDSATPKEIDDFSAYKKKVIACGWVCIPLPAKNESAYAIVPHSEAGCQRAIELIAEEIVSAAVSELFSQLFSE